jgi:hypothetical protein
MCYLQAFLKLAPYFPRKGVLWRWLHDVIPCWLLHDILTRSLFWDLGVTSLMNMGGRGVQLPRCGCALCWLFTLYGTLKGLYVKTVGWKGACWIFLLNFRCWRDGAGTSSYSEPSSHDLTRSQLFVRCKMVTKRTSLEMSHVELVTTIQELWNKPTTYVDSVECKPYDSRRQYEFTWKWEGIREGHADVRVEFRDWPANLLVMNECPPNVHVIDKTANVPRMTLGLGVFQGRSLVILYSRYSAYHVRSLLLIYLTTLSQLCVTQCRTVRWRRLINSCSSRRERYFTVRSGKSLWHVCTDDSSWDDK